MILISFLKSLSDLTKKEKKKQKKLEKQIIEDNKHILNDPDSKVGVILNFIIITLIIVSIGFIIFESVGNNEVKYEKLLFIIDGIISSLFAIEYFYRFYKAKEKLKFSMRFITIIDFVAFIPFFLEVIFVGMINISYLKALRILRIFRIFKLVKYFSSIGDIVKGIKSYREEYAVGAILVTIVLLLSSIVLYFIEGEVTPGFSSIPKSMWWAIVTMTTVGYGDIVPLTVTGKILGSIVILIGPMVVAMISSITVLVFFQAAEENKKRKLKNKMKPCKRCHNSDNLPNSNYCRRCGEKLNNKYIEF